MFVFNNFSVLLELFVFSVGDHLPLIVLGPGWPVNVNIVQVGQSSSVDQVGQDLHLISLHIVINDM